MPFYRIITTEEYDEWLEEETEKSIRQIDKRLEKIRDEGHFGTINNVSNYETGILKDQVWEIKFNDGRRIYYSCIPERNILLLIGGNKNGQDKDVKKAKSIFLKEISC